MILRRRFRGFDPKLHGANAFAAIDAINDFGDFAGAIHKSAIPVPGGREIGPLIGQLQLRGRESGFLQHQIEIRDSHREDMFSFVNTNRHLLKLGIHQVPDRDGVLHTILPKHGIPGTWGWEALPGVCVDLFDALLRKGEERDKDQFSAATPEVVHWLRQRRVANIFLSGLVYRICVGTSAINFAHAGFNVYVIKDATRDLDLPSWANVIDIMQKHPKIHEISSAELFELMDRFQKR